MNNDELDRQFLVLGCCFNYSEPKRLLIDKIMQFNIQDDMYRMRTKYRDSLASLIQTRYEEILLKYNKVFWLFGYYRLKKKKLGYFSDDELREIKIKTYKELLEYYNNILVPCLQRCSEKTGIISIENYKFRKLSDKSHLIK